MGTYKYFCAWLFYMNEIQYVMGIFESLLLPHIWKLTFNFPIFWKNDFCWRFVKHLQKPFWHLIFRQRKETGDQIFEIGWNKKNSSRLLFGRFYPDWFSTKNSYIQTKNQPEVWDCFLLFLMAGIIKTSLYRKIPVMRKMKPANWSQNWFLKEGMLHLSSLKCNNIEAIQMTRVRRVSRTL